MSTSWRHRATVLLAALSLSVLPACGSQTSEADDGAAAAADGATRGDGDVTSGAGGSSTSGAAVPAILDFTAETVAGDAFDGADLAGKPTVLWFWAPWCPTCHAQVSGVEELAATHGSDVNVVGVGALDELEAIEGFAEEVSTDVTLLADPDGAVWRHFEVTAQSTYVVLDSNGEQQAAGYLDRAELAAMVAELAG